MMSPNATVGVVVQISAIATEILFTVVTARVLEQSHTRSAAVLLRRFMEKFPDPYNHS